MGMEVGTSLEELLTGRLNKDNIRLVQNTVNFSLETADSMLFSAMKTGDIHFVQGRLSNAGPMTEGQALLMRKTREKREEQQFLNWLVHHVHETAVKGEKEDGEKRYNFESMQIRAYNQREAELAQKKAERKNDIFGGFFEGTVYNDRFGGAYFESGYMSADGVYETLGGTIFNLKDRTIKTATGAIMELAEFIKTPAQVAKLGIISSGMHRYSIEADEIGNFLLNGTPPSDAETASFMQRVIKGGPEAAEEMQFLRHFLNNKEFKAVMDVVDQIRENGGKHPGAAAVAAITDGGSKFGVLATAASMYQSAYGAVKKMLGLGVTEIMSTPEAQEAANKTAGGALEVIRNANPELAKKNAPEVDDIHFGQNFIKDNPKPTEADIEKAFDKEFDGRWQKKHPDGECNHIREAAKGFHKAARKYNAAKFGNRVDFIRSLQGELEHAEKAFSNVPLPQQELKPQVQYAAPRLKV